LGVGEEVSMGRGRGGGVPKEMSFGRGAETAVGRGEVGEGQR